jgi:hypothetical protein
MGPRAVLDRKVKIVFDSKVASRENETAWGGGGLNGPKQKLKGKRNKEMQRK